MTDFPNLSFALSAFHLIRPFWLLLLPLIAFFWWRTRRAATTREIPTDGLATHLRQAMTLDASARRLLLPVDGVAAVLVCAVLGASGPTWSRAPDPFLAQTAPVVIVLKVTPSMAGADVSPTRLDRAKFKIRDLLDLRAGARTALVAYAGTAHRVTPFTEDAQVMLPYLEGLSPEIMPQDGENAAAALALAGDLLAGEDTPGGILFVLDGLDTADLTALAEPRVGSLAFLEVLPEGVRDRGLDRIDDAPVIRVTVDMGDVRQLDRILNAAYREALLENGSQPWNDRGWWLAFPAALLTLIWFRRGWTMRWAVVLLSLSAGLLDSGAARADGMSDWFFTPDQQGQLAYQRKDFARAAELFSDPVWKGHALYRAGQYDKAADVLARLKTAEAAFTQGMAHIKNRQYRDGVRAFEAALERDPAYPGAAENLEIARRIVDYVENVREHSDTGEETGIGADEVVFDNESQRGADTQMDAPQGEGVALLTTEQWMNTVDTRTSDFLRQRFRLEAAQSSP